MDVDEDHWPLDADMMIAYSMASLHSEGVSEVDYVLPVQFEAEPGESLEWINLEVFVFWGTDFDRMLEGPGVRFLDGPVALTDGTYASDVDIHLSVSK